MKQLTRRQIVLSMMTGAAILHGKAIATEQAGQGLRRQMLLALDAIDDIVIRYRGRQVVLTPSEVMDQLGGK
jgi:hypothetical protein